VPGSTTSRALSAARLRMDLTPPRARRFAERVDATRWPASMPKPLWPPPPALVSCPSSPNDCRPSSPACVEQREVGATHQMAPGSRSHELTLHHTHAVWVAVGYRDTHHPWPSRSTHDRAWTHAKGYGLPQHTQRGRRIRAIGHAPTPPSPSCACGALCRFPLRG
jgi:hypothetical protein